MRYVVIGVIGAACFILGLAIVIATKAVNEAAVFMDSSFRWGERKKLLRRNLFMTINEYQKEAMRSANPQSLNDQAKGLSNTALGLCGESGEVADMIKKHLHQGHDLDKEHMVKELGDVAWYLALGATIIGYDLEDILQMNIDKLRARYPEGFDARRSQHRKNDDI